jgi:hypothetical protein
VTAENTVIKVWSVKTGACLMSVEDRPDPAVVCIAMEGQTLVVINEGTNTFRSWDLDGLTKLCEVSRVKIKIACLSGPENHVRSLLDHCVE